MFERFTRPARDVVTRATAYAVAATAGETRPEHLLRALLDDESSLAVVVLVDAGAPVARLREELDRHRARYVDGLDDDDAEALRAIGIDLDEVVRRIDRNLGGPRVTPLRPRFSRESKKSLELALREAIALQHRSIGAEHLLLGVVRSGDRVVADTLAACGVEPANLRRRVAEATRKVG